MQLLHLAVFLLVLAVGAVHAAVQASASHILVSDEALAKDLLTQIQGGADFAELARKHSSCPSKAKGGSLGTFKPGQMVPEFNDAVFSKANVGEVYGPVKTQFGHHLILVTARNE
jgi:peptidyl-prolyl cis-trans isomerase C